MTKIFVLTNGERQLVVYATTINSNPEDVLIIPVPNIYSLRFYDLRYYPTFFSDLNAPFAEPSSFEFSRGILFRRDEPAEIGNFIIKVLSQDEILVEYPDYEVYPEEYGYIACKLKPGNVEYHPIAYSHDIDEKGIFTPTLQNNGATLVEWDHVIYYGNCKLKDWPGVTSKLIRIGAERKLSIDWKKVIPVNHKESWSFNKGTLQKVTIKGKHRNRDIYGVI